MDEQKSGDNSKKTTNDVPPPKRQVRSTDDIDRLYGGQIGPIGPPPPGWQG